MTVSFTSALFYWAQTGISVDFSFAGKEISLAEGQEITEAVCQELYCLGSDKKSQDTLIYKMIFDNIAEAIDWWQQSDYEIESTLGIWKTKLLDSEISFDKNQRAYFKILEFLIFVSKKKSFYKLADRLKQVVESQRFKSLPKDWQGKLSDQLFYTVQDWCLLNTELTSQGPRKFRFETFELICCLVNDQLEQLESEKALVCLFCFDALSTIVPSHFIVKIILKLPRRIELIHSSDSLQRLEKIGRKYTFLIINIDSDQVRQLFSIPQKSNEFIHWVTKNIPNHFVRPVCLSPC